MRGILVDWIIDVHKKFKLKLECMFMSINLIDRVCQLTPIAKHRFQLLGITCLFIASKYEEIYPPYLSDFAFVCADAYTEADILSMEAEVLKILDFNLVNTSCVELIEAYSFESKIFSLFKLTNLENIYGKEKNLLLYVNHLLKLNLDLAIIRPSVIVPASIFLVKKILKKKLNMSDLIREFNSSEKKIKGCAKILAVMLSKESKSKLTACRRKFKADKFDNVSRIKISVKDVKERRKSQVKENNPKSARNYNELNKSREGKYPGFASPIGNTQTMLEKLRKSLSPAPNAREYSGYINSTLGILKASFGTKSRSKSRRNYREETSNENRHNLTSSLKNIQSTLKLNGRILVDEYSAKTYGRKSIEKTYKSKLKNKNMFNQQLQFHEILNKNRSNNISNFDHKLDT